MNNIIYTIKETNKSDCSLDNSVDDEYNSSDISSQGNYDAETSVICNELIARQIDYEMNYTSKYLGQILEYYGIKKYKLNKKNTIIKIVEFEMVPENRDVVDTRKRLFENFIELKNNSFFSKYIVSNLY